MWLTPLLLILFGLVEVIANAFFLWYFFRYKNLSYAKKFHGDLPAFANDGAWLSKILLSFILGGTTFAGACYLYAGSLAVGLFWSRLSSLVLLAICIWQAFKYGKSHLPARICPIFWSSPSSIDYFSSLGYKK